MKDKIKRYSLYTFNKSKLVDACDERGKENNV